MALSFVLTICHLSFWRTLLLQLMTFRFERSCEIQQNQALPMQKGQAGFCYFTFDICFPLWKHLHTKFSENLSPVNTNHHRFSEMDGVYHYRSSLMNRNLRNLTISTKMFNGSIIIFQWVHVCCHRGTIT